MNTSISLTPPKEIGVDVPNPLFSYDSFTPVAAPSIDATRLPWLADEYLSSLKGKIADKSRVKYEQRIRHFLRWLPATGGLTERDMANFAAYLTDGKLKIQTQADVISRVGQMFRWAYRMGVAKLDYSLWLPNINSPKPLFSPVSVDDVQALLAACTLTRYVERNQAMIAIMAGAGLRLEETVSLNVSDISFYADNSAGISIRSGKGRKSRVVVLPSHYGACARIWIERLRDDAPVFCSQKADRMTACGAHNEFKKIAAKAGLSVSCHDMRRHYASQWIIDHPGRYVELQKQMGHSDFSTTADYIWLTSDHIQGLLNE